MLGILVVIRIGPNIGQGLPRMVPGSRELTSLVDTSIAIRVHLPHDIEYHIVCIF